MNVAMIDTYQHQKRAKKRRYHAHTPNGTPTDNAIIELFFLKRLLRTKNEF